MLIGRGELKMAFIHCRAWKTHALQSEKYATLRNLPLQFSGPVVSGMLGHPLWSEQQITVSFTPYHKIGSTDTWYVPLGSEGNIVLTGAQCSGPSYYSRSFQLQAGLRPGQLCSRSRLSTSALSLRPHNTGMPHCMGQVSGRKKCGAQFTPNSRGRVTTQISGSEARSYHLEQRITHIWKTSSWHATEP